MNNIRDLYPDWFLELKHTSIKEEQYTVILWLIFILLTLEAMLILELSFGKLGPFIVPIIANPFFPIYRKKH